MSNSKSTDRVTEYLYQDRFNRAREKIIGKDHSGSGIGTLGEKTTHAILKNFYEPDADFQEVALEGYVADICNADGVTEIQSAQFNRLRDKLSVFLNLMPVTVVYPMPCRKWLVWIDPVTGETTKRRKAPKNWNVYYSFFELYKIKEFLRNPNLRLKIVLMDIEEYRLLDGWNDSRKKGSTRYDRIPIGICEEVCVDQPEDYLQFVPYELENGFDSKAFAKAARITTDTARQVLNILYYVGTVRRVGKCGNSILYEVNEID